MPLPRGAIVWSAVCDCGISWPYSTDFFHAILNSWNIKKVHTVSNTSRTLLLANRINV